MRTLRFLPVACIAVCFILACSREKSVGPREPAGESVRSLPTPMTIAGSGSNIPLTQKLLNAYAKKTGISISIPPSIGTTGAIKALQAGALDIGLISRSLRVEELRAGITQKKYARTGIVFAVHPGVPDDDISTGDLLDIFGGMKTKWSNGRTIIVLAREAGDSSNLVLEREIPGFKSVLEDALAVKRWDICYTDKDENDAIMITPDSLGLTDTAALVDIGSNMKPLSFNGVAPTIENIGPGKYPLFKDLYFAYREPLSDDARDFLDFVFSGEGSSILSGNGSLPLAGD